MVSFRTGTRLAMQVAGGDGIDVAKANGVVTISLDLAQFADLPSIPTELQDVSNLIITQEIDGVSSQYTMTIANFLTQFATYQPLDATLTALAGLNSTAGILTQTGADAFTKRTLTGTANEITVTNGDGAAGAPTFSIPSTFTLTGKTVTVDTQLQADNSTKVASTAYVRAAISAVLNGVSSAFDTLSEIATELALKAYASVTLTAGTGLTGGGDLSANRSFALDTSSTRNTDHIAVTLTAGAGLTGGGDISANRSFAVSFPAASTASTTATPNTGSFTGGDSAGWRYWQYGKMVFFRVTLTPTYAAAGGFVTIPLPVGTAAADYTASGFNASTALLVAAFITSGGTSMNVFRYDAAFPLGASEQKIVVSGFYETT